MNSFEDSSFEHSSFQEDSLDSKSFQRTALTPELPQLQRRTLTTELAELERRTLTPELAELERPALHTELAHFARTALKKAASSLELPTAQLCLERSSSLLSGTKLSTAWPQGGVLRRQLLSTQLTSLTLTAWSLWPPCGSSLPVGASPERKLLLSA